MSNETIRAKLYLPAQAAAETEATIIAWKVAEGDSFEKDDTLAEVESAKTSFTFEAPCDGAVVSLLYGAGDTVSFEEPVIEIETSDKSVLEEAPAVENTAGESEKTEEPHMDVSPSVTQSSREDGEICLLGIGSYVPERVVKTADLLDEFPGVTAEYIVGVTGIKERRWASEDQKPSDLAYNAAVQALEKSNLTNKDIDGIIVTTTTPDIIMPSTACLLQEKLGARGVPSFDLSAACSGWLYGITVAKGLILAGVGDRILVVGVDMHSRLLDKKDKGTFFLFGDGAGATIVSRGTDGHPLGKSIITADSKGINMAWRGLSGFRLSDGDDDNYVRLDGYALFRFATESFSTMIRDVITKSGWEPDDVRWVVPHQANGRILKAAAKKSGVSFDRFFLNIDHMGNTSSASIPLALTEIERGLQKKDKLVLCSVGAGITAAAISIQW
ncbi:MAG: beta-ketoacyl-ACP synthase 3 [Fibrobacterota bacterium]